MILTEGNYNFIPFFPLMFLIDLMGFFAVHDAALIDEKLCVPKKNLIPFFISFKSSFFLTSQDLFS